MIDINKIRKETIGCHDKLFFNSAGSSLPPAPVTTEMVAYLQEEEMIGGYASANKKSEEIQKTHQEVARLINTTSDYVAITYNATDAYARALSSIPFREGDTILTTTEDYVSNQIQFISLEKRFGVQVVRAPSDEAGDLDLNAFERLYKQYRPKLVAVTHVPTSSGLVQQVEEVGKICAGDEDCFYLVDACQSVGQLVVDVQKIQCDFLSATGRKFLRGPRGTGFLYVSEKVLEKGLEPLLLDLQGAEWIEANKYAIQPTAQRFELWEFQYASVIGLREAAKYANETGMEAIESYGLQLSNQMRQSLADISGVSVLDRGTRLSSIITLRKDGVEKAHLEKHLNAHQVYFSVGHTRNALLDFRKKGIEWVLRLSPHYFNTEAEIDRLTEVIKAM